MKFIAQSIADIILIEPNVHGDERGYFVESFRQDLLEQAVGYKVNFVQENESKSMQGVLRGLHYQLPPYAQSKLVRALSGKVLDVAVDIRKGSPSYGQHVAIELTAENKHQLFIPRGFAHGFVALTETATFAYKVDNYYTPKYDRGIAFDDEQLAIDWQFAKSSLKLSDKDKRQPQLTELTEVFDYRINYYA